jgi:hypothetical protein
MKQETQLKGELSDKTCYCYKLLKSDHWRVLSEANFTEWVIYKLSINHQVSLANQQRIYWHKFKCQLKPTKNIPMNHSVSVVGPESSHHSILAAYGPFNFSSWPRVLPSEARSCPERGYPILAANEPFNFSGWPRVWPPEARSLQNEPVHFSPPTNHSILVVGPESSRQRPAHVQKGAIQF